MPNNSVLPKSKLKRYTLPYLSITSSVVPLCSALFSVFFCASTYAKDYDLMWNDNPIKIEFDSSLNWGALLRTQNPDKNTINTPTSSKTPTEISYAATVLNGNDGDRNFNTGLISNRVGLTADMITTWQNYGTFIRARAYNDVYYTDHNPRDYQPKTGVEALGNSSDYNGDKLGKWQERAEAQSGRGFEFLDSYVYGNFDGDDHPLDIRLGRQVISWGESLAFPSSISSAQNSVDQEAGMGAGTVLKEIFRPIGSFYVQYGLTEALSVQSYYQYEHEGVLMAPAGTYWSEQDQLGSGGYTFYIPYLGAARRIDKFSDVKQGGQWGLATRYLTEGGTEFGIYNLRYHDRYASMSVSPLEHTYTTYYMEDIRLYGLSAATVIGKTNINGEISYRPNTAVVLAADPYGGAIVRGEFTQAQISWTNLFEPTEYYDNLTFVGEVVGWNYGAITGSGNEDKDLNNSNTKNGWAFRMMGFFAYKNIVDELDIEVPVVWEYTPDGSNFRSNTRNHASMASIGVTSNFYDWQFGIIYTQFDGPSSSKPIPDLYMTNDRDNLAFSIKLNF